MSSKSKIPTSTPFIMQLTAFDTDQTLSDILTDYLDGELDKVERQVFNEYLDRNSEEKEFADKARKGKQALRYLAKHLNEEEVRV
ncbi:MAG: hypothetical protein U5K69_20250 [Balneolaceae bacterium]|nr:hypothetical protein [Balneolaceae bacterium]